VVIAALYVDPAGVYGAIPGVECWGLPRDAREYTGPYPVIAHPPCQRWGSLAASNYARWGGEHNRPGNDGGTFAAALASVRRWGGVLEHPAKSRAFAAHGLPRPPRDGWAEGAGGWVCEVWQSAYGHRAAKATWLYYVGTERPDDLRWERNRGTHQVGRQDQRGKERNLPTLPTKEAAATPREFADALIALASTARVIYIDG
jgi:hypothetical protein